MELTKKLPIHDEFTLKYFRKYKTQTLPTSEFQACKCDFKWMLILESLKMYNCLPCPGNYIFLSNFESTVSRAHFQ